MEINKLKVYVNGYNGQLGYDVYNKLIKSNYDVTKSSSKELNIKDKESVKKYFEKNKFDIFIHCAAYTNVDQAEIDQKECYEVNVEGTKNLVLEAQKQGAKFFYISTDYVFNSQDDKPISENEKINPVNYYGKTKALGEEIVKSSLNNYFILRISWVFGKNGNNFIKKMIELSKTRKELKVVSDQIGSPTYTQDIANLILDMIKTKKYGVYHVTNKGYISWYQFAKTIFEILKSDIKINKCDSNEFKTIATRPKNSRLDNLNLIKNGFKELPDYRESIKKYLKEIKEID